MSPERGSRARRRLGAIALLALLIAGAAVFSAHASPAREIERVVSDKGIVAWLVAEPAVPLIAVRFAFRGGTALEPPGKEGLTSMVAALLDEGAGPFDSKAFQDRLADRAIRLSFEAGSDSFGGSLETLSERKAEAFELLRLALAEPRFDPEPVARIREQMQISLAQNREDPEWLAMRAWLERTLPDHPYGRSVSGTETSLAAISREDLLNFQASRFARDNLIVAVVGDITAQDLKPLLDGAFGALPEHAAPWQVSEAVLADPGALDVIERPIPQSIVVFGAEGVKRHDPDFYAAYVMNEMFGGGAFTARLTKEVREKRGLAYAVYTYLNPLEHAGLFMGSVATQNDRVAESLAIIKAEMTKFRDEGLAPDELKDAKLQITGSYPLRFDSNDHIADFLVSVQLDDLGIDYIEKRNEYIEAVSAADVARAAQRLLRPERLRIAVAGEPKGLSAP